VKQHLGILIDTARDELIPEKGMALLSKKGFYKKDNETSPQETMARAATCYCFGDYEFAQRMYDYQSKAWYVDSSPVKSNAIEIEWPTFGKDEFQEAGDWLEENIVPDGLPISCYLGYIPDTKEGLTYTRNETAWLSMMGGGVGVYTGMRSPDEKSTGAMAHLKGYDADTLSYKQKECYAPDTEILTTRGWVRFDQTKPDDVVAISDSTGKLTFERPEEWMEYDHCGDMISIKAPKKGLDLLVTPNHELCVSRRRTKGWSDLEKVFACDLSLHNEIKFLTTSTNDAKEGYILEPIERLMLAHQADGHNYKACNKIGFHFSKGRKKDRLCGILDDCGISYSLTGTDTHRFYVYTGHLPKDLNWIDLETTSANKALALLEEISYWDGHRTNSGTITFSSCDEGTVEIVQALSIIAGLGSSSINTYQPKKNGWSTMYSIEVGTRGHFLAEKLVKDTVHYEGKVYCCRVSTGNLFIRAGKCPLICGNSRRGSIAAYMDIDHPEIKQFISMRDPAGGGDMNKKCFNMNNAVNITDDFMEKAILGQDYELVDPKHGPTGDFLNASSVFEELMEMRHQTGEPYLNFIDTVNRNRRPWITKKSYHVSQSNLCNEIHLMTSAKRTAVCCLSSLNLAKYDEWKDTNIVQDLCRYLDNILEYFIRLAPSQLKRAVHSASQERAIGIGTLGWHSLLQKRNLAFESGGANSAASLNYEVYTHIESEFIKASQQLALERGEPEDCIGGGMRNSHGIAIAPNVSSADMVGESCSIEPWKSNAFVAQGRSGSFLVKNKYLESVLEKLGRNTGDVWKQILEADGSVAGLDFLTDQDKKVFATAKEIDPMWIIEHASIRQPHICQGQSINTFKDNSWTMQDMIDLHIAAWAKGLKGLYYMRGEAADSVNVTDKIKPPLNQVRPVFKLDECLSCHG
jgi:ribonucleoside-diphosphate reductase alpha chain